MSRDIAKKKDTIHNIVQFYPFCTKMDAKQSYFHESCKYQFLLNTKPASLLKEDV